MKKVGISLVVVYVKLIVVKSHRILAVRSLLFSDPQSEGLDR